VQVKAVHDIPDCKTGKRGRESLSDQNTDVAGYSTSEGSMALPEKNPLH